MSSSLVVIRGGGDLGSGVAHRLYLARYRVAILELAQPTVIRRTVAFASAVYEGEVTIEGVRGIAAASAAAAQDALERGDVPVLIDPHAEALATLLPAALVDARLAKRNLGTSLSDAPVVIGLGPGFVAGVDVHAVIETQRGHDLGRVIWQGAASANTGVPGRIGGEDEKRVLRSPCAGVFRSVRQICGQVAANEVVGYVVAGYLNETPVTARISGVLRGIMHDGVAVAAGVKVGDVDPRGVVEHCFTVSDKALAIGGGVLEALLHLGVLP